MKRIANRHAHEYVSRREPFKGSNLYGERLPGGGYVVYSYGPHWPLYVYDGTHWWRNEDKYGTTTSKHSGQACPRHEYLNSADRRALLNQVLNMKRDGGLNTSLDAALWGA